VTVGGLTNGHAYTVRVAAANAVGRGPASPAGTAVTPRTTPGAPKLGTVSPAHEALVVRWATPTSNGGSAITGYVVRTYAGGSVDRTIEVAASARSVTIRGLVPTGPYLVRVQAVNAAGGGTWSASSGVVRAGR
jgi:hypothetical protein